MSEANGILSKNIAEIKHDVNEMRSDLTRAVEHLTRALDSQAAAIRLQTEALGKQSTVIAQQTGAIAAQTIVTNSLITRWEVFSQSLLNSIPIKAVMWMFLILGLTIVLVIAGVEGVRAIAPNLAGWMQ